MAVVEWGRMQDLIFCNEYFSSLLEVVVKRMSCSLLCDEESLLGLFSMHSDSWPPQVSMAHCLMNLDTFSSSLSPAHTGSINGNYTLRYDFSSSILSSSCLYIVAANLTISFPPIPILLHGFIVQKLLPVPSHKYSAHVLRLRRTLSWFVRR